MGLIEGNTWHAVPDTARIHSPVGMVAGVTLRLDGGGVRAVDPAGNEIEGHQSFWFAWSQFMPDTLLWQS